MLVQDKHLETPHVHLIIQRVTKLAISTSDERIKLDTLPYNAIVRWHRIVARDVTNNPTRVELWLYRDNQGYLLKAGVQGAAARTFAVELDIVSPGAWVPMVKFVGATADDELELYAYGELVQG